MSKKFSELTQLTTPATGDILPIDDVSAGSTKKITISDLVNTSGAINKGALSTDSSWAMASWTPTITAAAGSPVIGNGSFSCQYIQLGKLVFGHFKITRGSTTSWGTGEVRFSLPTAASSNQGTSAMIGTIYIIDASAPADYGGFVSLTSSSTFRILFHNDTTGGGMRAVSESAAQPFGWATGDIIDGNFTYEAA